MVYDISENIDCKLPF